jgi:phenylalanyl-tRNA synthetase beta chain
MKIELNWLNDYTNLTGITPKEYADAMTMSGSKVETVEQKGKDIKNVVTGKVLSIKQHENAEKLVICSIDIGKNEPLQIVTGAKNLHEGDIVPVALHGALLPGGIKIKKGKLRGEVSEGMLCSHEELGLTPEELGYEPEYGILILKPDTKIGIDIKEVFGMEEVIVDFEITSNRPDCFSVIGLARESAATFKRPFQLPEPKVSANEENATDYAKVTVEAPDLCSRYSARIVKNVKIGPSPAWLVKRLNALGVRSINNIVDITNYVMLEYGQPMHAFDLRDLDGNHIIVRRAKDGEKITTLDKVDRTLDSSMLVIADESKAVAVAGVMGALNSEVKDDTTTILFESATFEPASVRITAKKLSLRTEASAKYEKGLDPYNTIPAVNRACELVNLLEAGEIVGGIIDIHSELPHSPHIPFRPERIRSFLGIDVSMDDMVRILEKLECKVDLDNMEIVPPSFRPDLELEADIAEEVLRFYGYDKVPSAVISGETTQGFRTESQRLWKRISNVAVACGLYEVTTFTFTNPNIFDKLNCEDDSEYRNCVKIANPLGVENSVMRTVSFGSMLEVLSRNFNRRNEEAKLFEQAKIFIPTANEELPIEKERLAIGMYGPDVDFYSLKGALEEIFLSIGIKNYDFEPMIEGGTFHPGRTAIVSVGGEVCGIAGEIHPMVLKNFDIGTRCYVAEIDFDLLLKYSTFERQYKPMPKFPAVTRDLSILVNDGVWATYIKEIICKNAGKILDNVRLFDVYKGSQLPENTRSMAYSLTFRADDRTLTDSEVNEAMDRIVNALQSEIKARLR